MTATERVRELLDERGVEWTEGIARPELTQVRVGGKVVKFHSWQPNTLKVSLFNITPEQAIAATLDSCNCSNSERMDGTCKVDVLNTGDCAGYECSEYIMHCNGCGHEFGHVLYNEDGDVWMSEKPRYCPNCGRKVVDE